MRPLAVEIRHTTSMVKSYIDRKIGKNIAGDLTGSECMVLFYILKNSHAALKTSFVIERFRISKGTASQILSSLESKGYISQKISPHDHRAKEIVLTRKSRILKKKMDDAMEEVAARLEDNYTPEERRELVRLLDIMRNNIREEIGYGCEHDCDAPEED